MPSKGEAKVTTDHNEIRRWTEARGGHPATVEETGGKGAGLLRIDLPGYRGKQRLRKVPWDDFFEKFDEKGLAFLYLETTATGRKSRFSKRVNRKGRGRGAAARPGQAKS